MQLYDNTHKMDSRLRGNDIKSVRDEKQDIGQTMHPQESYEKHRHAKENVQSHAGRLNNQQEVR